MENIARVVLLTQHQKTEEFARHSKIWNSLTKKFLIPMLVIQAIRKRLANLSSKYMERKIKSIWKKQELREVSSKTNASVHSMVSKTPKLELNMDTARLYLEQSTTDRL